MKIMKDQRDLDPFDSDQIDLTREIDKHGEQAVMQICHAAMRLSLTTQVVLNQIPLSMWQRAAFESNAAADSSGDVNRRGIADLIWLVCLFMQDALKHTDKYRAIDEVREKAASFGFDIPKPEEDEE